MKNNLSIFKTLLTIIAFIISIVAIAIIGSYVMLYLALYMIVAMIVYGTQTVLIATASVIGGIITLIIIRKAIKHRRKKVYTYGR